jgi:hypothetical protein
MFLLPLLVGLGLYAVGGNKGGSSGSHPAPPQQGNARVRVERTSSEVVEVEWPAESAKGFDAGQMYTRLTAAGIPPAEAIKTVALAIEKEEAR